MQLNELFNDVYDYDLEERDGDWGGVFYTKADRPRDREEVTVTFSQFHVTLEAYEVEFDVGGDYGITNTKGTDAIKIFGTVLEIIRAFVKKQTPNIILFSSKEPSRKKLYARLSKKLCTLMGFTDMTAKLNELGKQEVVYVDAKAPKLAQVVYFFKRFQENTMDDYENTILVRKGFA